MTTALITHPACLRHVTPSGHPERVDRLKAVLAAFEEAGDLRLAPVEAPRAEIAAIARAHDGAYIEALKQAVEETDGAELPLDPDTWVSGGSWEAALRAAGAAVAGVDGVVRGEWKNAFCAVRPPGHHAERARAMGFCLFNNAVVAAKHARAAHGLARVAIIDFDVHHGNGGQQAAETDADLFYGSIHQGGIYPGSGLAHETGPAHNIANAPMPGGTDGAAWRPAFETIVAAMDAFQPELVIISAGFDAHRADPLAGMRLEEADFAWATQAILEVAAPRAKGRVVSTLEGGYDLPALARSAVAHARVLARA